MNKPNVLLQAGTSRVVIASTKDNIYELSVEHWEGYWAVEYFIFFRKEDSHYILYQETEASTFEQDVIKLALCNKEHPLKNNLQKINELS